MVGSAGWTLAVQTEPSHHRRVPGVWGSGYQPAGATAPVTSASVLITSSTTSHHSMIGVVNLAHACSSRQAQANCSLGLEVRRFAGSGARWRTLLVGPDT